MADRRLIWWEGAGCLTALLLGTLLRFAYGWSGGKPLAGFFSAVNGSVWEHMKLLFFPLFLFSVVQVCCMGRNYANFLAVRAVSILAGLAAIPALYYTCAGVWGASPGWLGMAAFLLADLGTFWLDGRLLRRGRFSSPWQQVAGLLVLWGLAFSFVWCTFRPLPLALWRDPAAGNSGVMDLLGPPT